MRELKSKNLAFFFTKGLSLAQWDEKGILLREIEIYNRLAKYFNIIYFFTYGDRNEFKYKDQLEPNIRIIPNSKKMNSNLYSLIIPMIYRRILSRCHFLKTNQMNGAWTAFLSSYFKGKFILRTGYSWSLFVKEGGKNPLIQKTIRMIEKIMYKSCDQAIVSSKQDFHYIAKNYGININKLNIIPNSVNTEIFKPLPKIKYENRILYVGRLEKQKNLVNLVKSLTNLSLTLDIIGEGSLKSDILRISKLFDVKINFLGLISNYKLPNIINRYKIFVLPSYYEGMPKSLLEAMSCGLACIVTKIPSIKEVIIEKKTGLFTKSYFPKDIRETILGLQQSKKLQNKLGRNAHDFIEKHHSIQNIIKLELLIYKQCS
ncbi:MAG: glycosyltransferase [Candidatus Hermodarchaeota archaeon]